MNCTTLAGLVTVLLALTGFVRCQVINVTYTPGGPDLLYNPYYSYPVTKAQAQQYCNTGAPAFPVVEATIDGVHQAMLNGSLTCSQLVGYYLQRIQAYNGQLNAVRVLNPALNQTAAMMDAALQQYRTNGTALPVLFCVPFLIKDNFDTVDGNMSTSNGAVALLDNVPTQDATEVAQIKQYGAILLGKANMAEWAFSNAISVGSAFGVVRNPYDLARTSAGSSGGPAAAAAASLAMIVFGSDTGNSIRGPSGHQGLVGIRSSIGLTSRAGIIPLVLNRDIGGPMGRSVSDVAKVFTAITDFSAFPAGYDPRDPVTAYKLNYTVPSNYTQFLNPNGLQGKRIGVLRSYVSNPFNDPVIVANFEQALQDLAAGGATIVDNFTIVGNSLGDQNWTGFIPVTTTAPNGSLITTGASGFNNGSWYTGFGAQGKWESINTQGCPNFREDLEAYLQANTTRSRYRTLLDVYRGGEFHPSVTTSITGPLFQNNYSTSAVLQQPFARNASLVCTCGEFFNNPCRMEIRQRMIESMDALNLSALVYPGWGNAPRLIGDLNQPGSTPLGDFSQGLLPATGAPGIVVPMGQHRLLNTPTTLQIAARPFDEPVLFQIAYAYEQLTKKRVPPPAFPECRGPATASAVSAAG